MAPRKDAVVVGVAEISYIAEPVIGPEYQGVSLQSNVSQNNAVYHAHGHIMPLCRRLIR